HSIRCWPSRSGWARRNTRTRVSYTTTLSGGPAALFAGIANLTAVNCAGSANGGNISYSDIITLLPQMADVKGVGPFCWYMSPRTFFQRVLGLIDTTSR